VIETIAIPLHGGQFLVSSLVKVCLRAPFRQTIRQFARAAPFRYLPVRQVYQTWLALQCTWLAGSCPLGASVLCSSRDHA